MSKTLHITNGDSAVEVMKQANIEGDFLPWRDVLHEGPVPKDLSLSELSALRAKFISDVGWGTFEKVSASFIERDRVLKSLLNASSNPYQKVILWFEHDLYDQLQIIQILDWFNTQDVLGHSAPFELSMICVDQYLGMLSTDEMENLFHHEALVTQQQLSLSSQAWLAFVSDTPEDWCALLNIDTDALPFLKGAVIRQLEEYPNHKNGLSRTANRVLSLVSQGESHPWNVFKQSQQKESRVYMGDSSFWLIIERLLSKNNPSNALLALPKDIKWSSPPTTEMSLTITPIGQAVLSGKSNWLELSEVDQWMGGVHLHIDNLWCWHDDSKSIIKRDISTASFSV